MQRIYGYTFIPYVRASAFLLIFTCLCSIFIAPALAQKGEAEVLLAQATMAYDEKKYQETLDLLNQAHERDPQNARILITWG